MNFMEVIEIFALTIIAIFIFMIISSRYYTRKLENGTLKPIQQVEYITGTMLTKLRNFRAEVGLGDLRSLIVLDEYIEKQTSIYPVQNILKDHTFILECGSFLGSIIKTKKHYSWKFENGVPMLVKKNEIIYPFELIKEKINKGSDFSLYNYVCSINV